MDKTALRKQMLQLRSQLKPKYLENSAKRMGGQIAALSAFRDAELVMLYHSFKNEAGTLPLIQYCLNTNKKVALPLVVKTAAPEGEAALGNTVLELQAYQIPGLDALKPGSMGIPEPDPLLCEPVDPTMIDLIVVPGIAFDATGGRIGYGKGCYDRFLPQLLDDVPIIGLAYDFQVLPRVPQESTDVRMDAIVTEKGILTMPHSKLHI
ncbi:MAG: 5-formyltetrahydrofolate cyclo-ligase [Firmicutes bacterium]|nr:5-formyltetrahydrofolate cyclo-ligase [Bacillota bacterium]